ncbi:MAG: DUF1659 domain-containing protein [Turicibacter sp.]|uniref:DUF1659 domain-containing protein n=1 Tax=Turicibacter faecis TaxID=2963365 RepID=A0ABN6Z9E5_9FIRM|nr:MULTISPECIES: DUF1659 domain-containing protein [unclassified Turicibacter]MCI8701516.1 DUF1659 domain-containing protein [Turicibacter sp.]MCU7205486.1 DUF1659 domain-containing protein [Turicibacter sp. TA25]NCE79189.1 DUF1659 domain-containing protein [Turicibacter sp. TS3]BEH90481.1 hypothetical protein T23_05830 [Turicibacter sp. TC023]
MNDIYDRRLSIYLNVGLDDDGKDIIKAKTFSNVRLDTTDEELTEFAQKYVALSSGANTKNVVADYRML